MTGYWKVKLLEHLVIGKRTFDLDCLKFAFEIGGAYDVQSISRVKTTTA